MNFISNKKVKLTLLFLTALLIFLLGLLSERYFISSGRPAESDSSGIKMASESVGSHSESAGSSMSHPKMSAEKKSGPAVWTCSMHPNIKLLKFGKCPICFMDLIPLENNGNAGLKPNQLKIGSHAEKLMDIETSPVQRQFVESHISMTGKVDYDETGISNIASWINGRLEKLYVNYTGIPVKEGDHLAEIYSPDLITGQAELIQALKTARALSKNASEIIRRTSNATVGAAREKLRLLGMKKAQIRQVEQTGRISEFITVYSPTKGIVIKMDAREGMYVKTGTSICTVADLSRVWIRLEAYESDLQYLKYGGKVSFTTESIPGREYTGLISFIDPFVNPETRTVGVRVSVDNSKMELKPGMFVRAKAVFKVASDSRVMNEELHGKWISPMHPEIIKDEPGICDVCSMPLVSAESLGYVDSKKKNAPLVIPVSSALRTGTRAVVYVKVKKASRHSDSQQSESSDKIIPDLYEGREIVLGPRTGGYYIVKNGLQENELVVTRGAFKIDAELQIQARPSMMSFKSEQLLPEYPESLLDALGDVIMIYFQIHSDLAHDSHSNVKEYSQQALNLLDSVTDSSLKPDAAGIWSFHSSALKKGFMELSEQSDIQQIRKVFYPLSSQMERTVKAFPVKKIKLYKAFCPMAFDNTGASWLQGSDHLINPYFGSAMYRCGTIKGEITPGSGDPGHE
jgi:Cu(I)/Ag(I) efflux system membrane fusion protein